MKNYQLDARDLPCPKPLLRTKEALDDQNFDVLEILVNNTAARENVCRFLTKSGLTEVRWDEADGMRDTWRITAARTDAAAPAVSVRPEPAPESRPEAASGKTVFIGADRIGRGDDELGKLLMKGFLYTLTQLDTPPACLIFMNGGVLLTLEGSESLNDLKVLEERGIRVLVCGTCLDYLKVKDRCRIGTVSNMYEIAGAMTDPSGLICFS